MKLTSKNVLIIIFSLCLAFSIYAYTRTDWKYIISFSIRTMVNLSKFKPAGVAKICANIPDSKTCYLAFSQSIGGIIFSADAPLLAAPVFHICRDKAPTCHNEIWSEIIDDIKIENLWIHSAANFSSKSGLFVMELNMLNNFLRTLRENIVKKEVKSEFPEVRTAALQLISKIDKKIIYVQDYSKNNLVDDEALQIKNALHKAKIKK